jgi:hypothetical protein
MDQQDVIYIIELLEDIRRLLRRLRKDVFDAAKKRNEKENSGSTGKGE